MGSAAMPKASWASMRMRCGQAGVTVGIRHCPAGGFDLAVDQRYLVAIAVFLLAGKQVVLQLQHAVWFWQAQGAVAVDHRLAIDQQAGEQQGRGLARTRILRRIGRRAADGADSDLAAIIHLHRIGIAFVVRDAVFAVVVGGSVTIALAVPAEHAVVGTHQ